MKNITIVQCILLLEQQQHNPIKFYILANMATTLSKGATTSDVNVIINFWVVYP